MDASDWIRIKKLNGARGNIRFVEGVPSPVPFPTPYRDIVNPPPRLEAKSGRKVYTEFGTSKIRRPASNWTDYVASQKGDYVVESPATLCGTSKELTIHRVCYDCAAIGSAIKHNGLCSKCVHDRIVVRPLTEPVTEPVVIFIKISSVYCDLVPISVVAGITYTITNNSSNTEFLVTSGGSLEFINIPSGGPTTITFGLSGLLECGSSSQPE